MPELKKNDAARGSTLVGVLALSIIMGIAAAGFIQVAANVVDNENMSMRECKAFASAESGVWLAARWLKERQLPIPSAVRPFASRRLNSLWVVDSIFDSIGDTSFARVKSRVYADSSLSAGIVRITCSLRRSQWDGAANVWQQVAITRWDEKDF
jgi:hypothetical protein